MIDQSRRPRWRRFGLDWIEAAAAHALVAALRLLPLPAASAAIGGVARAIGPLLPVSARADANLRRVLPELSATQRRAVIGAMWDNFGRTAAELSQLDRYGGGDGGGGFLAVEGLEHVEAAALAGKPILFVSAHFGNWEVLGVLAKRIGLDLVQIYRPANNPLVDRLMRRLRAPAGSRLVPKGQAGTRAVLKAARAGEPYGMLVDQKLNEGIDVPFFGLPAKTTPIVGQIALRYGYAVLPAMALRVGGCRIRVVVEAPIPIPREGDEAARTAAIATAVNAMIERWIRAHPGQWLWLHRRWGKD